MAGYAHRLGIALGTGTSGGNNKFLRPPGTFNHKARPLNAERRFVELLAASPEVV